MSHDPTIDDAAHEALPADPPAWLRTSWDWLQQAGCPAHERADAGLQGVLRSFFPVKDGTGRSELVFVSYAFQPPRHDEAAARRGGHTLAAPLVLTVQLILYDEQPGGHRTVRDIKEQEVFLGSMPWPTARGTVIVDGVERLLLPRRAPVAGPSRSGDTLVVHSEDGGTLSLRRDGVGFEASLSLAPWSPIELAGVQGTPRRLALDTDGASLILDGTAPGRVFVAPRDGASVDGPMVRKRAQLTHRRFDTLRDAGITEFPLSARDAVRFVLAEPASGADGALVAPAGQSLSPVVITALVKARVTEVRVWLLDEQPRTVTASGLPDPGAVASWYESVTPWRLLLGLQGRARLDSMVASHHDEGEGLMAVDVRSLASALRDGDAVPALTTRSLGPGELLAVRYSAGLRRVADEIRARLDLHADRIDTVMPHELIDARPVSEEISGLLGDPDACPRVDGTPVAGLVTEAW